MQRIDGRWVISPQDIVAEFECEHRVSLNAAVSGGALAFTPTADPGLDLLRRLGIEHEQRRLENLPPSWRVVRLPNTQHSLDSYQAGWVQTRQAMAEEVDAIYQAMLFTGDFVGLVDFLVLARDAQGSVLRDGRGRAIYEPIDAKSARSAKRAAALQVGAYALALERLDMPSPQQVHLWLAGDVDWHGPAAPFAAVAQVYAQAVAARLPSLGSIPVPDWAAPREACPRCRFDTWCSAGRSRDRDICLVQGIRAATRERLVSAGLETIDALAVAGPEQRPAQVSQQTFERLQAQAALQVRAEASGTVIVEVTDAAALAELPDRSAGDLWFDMEGDPHAGPNGLEYMFGFCSLNGDDLAFASFEAHDAPSERKAFEAFVDLVTERIATYPQMHVYHYADYERRTLRRLAQQHGTREEQIDRMLREGRLVDLYGIVRRGLRVSTPSLSLKDVEAAYQPGSRDEEVTSAMASVVEYERIIALRAAGLLAEAEQALAAIRAYNERDCASTMQLDTFLRDRIGSAAPVVVDPTPKDDVPEIADPHQELVQALLDGVPPQAEDRTEVQHARALLAAALQYHRREARPAWWELFTLMTAELEDLSEATNACMATQVSATDWSTPPRARRLQRRLTIQCDSDPRTMLEPGGQAFALYEHGVPGMRLVAGSTRGYQLLTIEAIGADDAMVTVVERAGPDGVTWPATPIALLPGPPYDTRSIQRALAVVAARAQAPAGQWSFPPTAWADLLLRRPPRLRSGSLARSGEATSDVVASLMDCEDSYVAVQGPPGTGKTYVGSQAVARLARAGWRIGVVAQSHAVVDHFLHGVRTADASVAIGKEPQQGVDGTHPWHLPSGQQVHTWASATADGYVIGGTAWTFTRESVQALGLDLLVVDEAGQFALANAVACALAARNVLLLGDPQQLPQVSQAAHPEEIETSVLGRIIDDHPTMPPDRGIFLPRTYRMHPRLTRPVSLMQYEGRLEADPVTVRRHLDGIAPGLLPVPVEHIGNTTSCEAEAQAIVQVAQHLIGRAWTGADLTGLHRTRPLVQPDILVVAPYNAQVRLIRWRLDQAGLDRIAVGTVDKFQGREAVIAIVSMTASSAEDIPRGLEFLLSPNRINVAISRAQWASYLVHSPALRLARPSSVEGLRRLGMFIRLIDEATVDT